MMIVAAFALHVAHRAQAGAPMLQVSVATRYDDAGSPLEATEMKVMSNGPLLMTRYTTQGRTLVVNFDTSSGYQRCWLLGSAVATVHRYPKYTPSEMIGFDVARAEVTAEQKKHLRVFAGSKCVAETIKFPDGIEGTNWFRLSKPRANLASFIYRHGKVAYSSLTLGFRPIRSSDLQLFRIPKHIKSKPVGESVQQELMVQYSQLLPEALLP